MSAATMIEAARALAAGRSDAAPTIPAPAAATRTEPASDFGQLISRGIGEVNQQLLGSQVDLQRLATGDVQNLHQIMIRLEESRLSFQLLLQVRTRLLEAYQDIMKMQV